MTPAREYGQREDDMIADVEEGTLVRCVYCPVGRVEIDQVDHDPQMTDVDGNPVPDGFWCEGFCHGCQRRVEFDYKPRVPR